MPSQYCTNFPEIAQEKIPSQHWTKRQDYTKQVQQFVIL